jgi:hypothetical protein
MTSNADWAKCVMPANNSASQGAKRTVIAPVLHADAVMPPAPVTPVPQRAGQRAPLVSATLLSAPTKTSVVLARSAKSSLTRGCRFLNASKILTLSYGPIVHAVPTVEVSLPAVGASQTFASSIRELHRPIVEPIAAKAKVARGVMAVETFELSTLAGNAATPCPVRVTRPCRARPMTNANAAENASRATEAPMACAQGSAESAKAQVLGTAVVLSMTTAPWNRAVGGAAPFRKRNVSTLKTAEPFAALTSMAWAAAESAKTARLPTASRASKCSNRTR